MAQIRTLKLNLLADVTKFGAGMAAAGGDIRKLDTATQRSAQRIKAAFAGVGVAAGYMALRIGKEAVTAAVEDEASQKRLKKALENTTGATNDSIAATEDWITKQQFAKGFTDTQLRISLGKLVGVTNDVTEAQKLLNLAQDISRGTGKNLEDVSLALAKAHEGNLGALTRLGVPLDDNIKKTKDFEGATKALSELFGGQAATYAETYQGKLDIVNQRLGELKESAGTKLLPVLGNLLDITNKVAIGFSGNSASLASSMSAVTREGYYTKTGGENLGSALKNVTDNTAKLFGVLKTDGAESSSILNTLATSLNLYAKALGFVADNAERTKKYAGWLFKGGVLGSIVRKVGSSGIPQMATGGSVKAGQAYTVGEFGRETFIPNTSGRIVPNGGSNGNVTINLNGIIDAESARRSIERLLQDSGRRTAAVNLVGSSL